MSRSPSLIVHSDSPEALLAVLSETHPDVVPLICARHEDLPGLLSESAAEIVYSVRFESMAPFPRRALVDSPSVRWVSVGGSGTDHVRPWNPARLTVTNAAGVAAGMMAEYALGMVLAFSLDLPGFARRQRQRRWLSGARVRPVEGSTILILGLGRTGRAAAVRARALGLRTIGVRANPQPTPFVDEVHPVEALPRLWARADFILCCVPLVDGTRSMVGADAFAAMKPDAVLIDVSRGGVVDEPPLLAALESGKIKGAALDVFRTEPLPPDHPLWGFENVVVTPHCSSVYDGWETGAARMFAQNLARYRAGEPLENVVDPVRGY